jgi:hypothetical protein
MLNEVRRKPEKPRIRITEHHGQFYCSSDEIVHVGKGFNQKDAYQSWLRVWRHYANDTNFALCA